MKIKLSATIPVQDYGNIIPEVEVEGETFQEAFKEAEGYITEIWNKHGKVPLTKGGKLIDCFVGGQIEYDDLNHIYTWKGEKYLSGSEYAKQGEKPFDSERVSEAMAKRDGTKKEDILKMWELNSKASTEFGSSIHTALEAFGKYGVENKQPYIKDCVQSFYASHKGKAEFEVFVVNHDKKHAGQIDRLEILGDKHCRVTDYKTNAEIEKSLPMYFKQLQFYTEIMVANGWVAEPPVIYWWNGKWETITKEKI